MEQMLWNLKSPWPHQGFGTLDRVSWVLRQAGEDKEGQKGTGASHLRSQLPRRSRQASGSRLTLGKKNRKGLRGSTPTLCWQDSPAGQPTWALGFLQPRTLGGRGLTFMPSGPLSPGGPMSPGKPCGKAESQVTWTDWQVLRTCPIHGVPWCPPLPLLSCDPR